MTIELNYDQANRLLCAVADRLRESRDAAEYYPGYSNDSEDWAELYRIFRPIHKHKEKQQPKRYPHRRRRRILRSLTRRLREEAQEVEPQISPPTRWEQVKHSFSAWLNR
jgi:hypothetical protein